MVAVIAGALVQYRAGAPRLALTLLILSAIVFNVGHPRPFGPAAMAMFAVGAALSEFAPRRTRVS